MTKTETAPELETCRSLTSRRNQDELRFLAADLNEARIKQGYYVVFNGFQNEDVEALTRKFSSFVLFNFCLKDDNEFFSLGFTEKDGAFRLCYIRNGFSNM